MDRRISKPKGSSHLSAKNGMGCERSASGAPDCESLYGEAAHKP